MHVGHTLLFLQEYCFSDQACVSQKTRELLGPVDFSGLFSGEFLVSRKAFLNAPENTPDSHPSFSVCSASLIVIC